MTKRFQRTVEDFTCAHCGTAVQGNGYTNHCPKCLWSKHVDVNPGDRLASCGGLMEPVSLEVKSDTYTVIHRCTACGMERRVKSDKGDDFESLIALARK